MHKNLQQTLKTVLISSVVTATMIIWYGIFGERFLTGIVFVSLAVILADRP